MYQLVIGNQNYSSWSLRPWILMKTSGIPFEEKLIQIYTDAGKAQLHELSSANKVPLLITQEQTIWDSLAIVEYLAEQHPEKQLWPEDIQLRAMARSITSEMHASFDVLRNALPMNCRCSGKYTNINAELQQDIERICQIWRDCRAAVDSKGDFLFGSFGIADAFYAPIVLRFNSYQIDVGEIEQRYMQAILNLPGIREWIDAAKQDETIVPHYEVI